MTQPRPLTPQAFEAALRAKGGLLVVDEAFMDVGPREESLAGDVEAGGIAVLRSFGKFFGLAGVRLGFVLADAATAARLEARLGPWAVSGPALEYGTATWLSVRPVRADAAVDCPEAHRSRLDAMGRR